MRRRVCGDDWERSTLHEVSAGSWCTSRKTYRGENMSMPEVLLHELRVMSHIALSTH